MTRLERARRQVYTAWLNAKIAGRAYSDVLNAFGFPRFL